MHLNVGGFELDHGDPHRAIELLARCDAIASEQGLSRNRGWASAELAAAALQIGDHERARSALEIALRMFGQLAEERGTLYARALQERLGALATAD